MIIKPLKNHEELCKCVALWCQDRSPEEIKADMGRKDGMGRIWTAMLKRNMASQVAAAKWGYVGVGRISVADARLVKFQQRLMRKAGYVTA